MDKPWGGMDPNSHHQLWSRWEFTIIESGKHPPLAEVKNAAARWFRTGFGTAGRFRIEERVRTWVITLEVEGAPAHDPDYVAAVSLQFQRDFVEKGWGQLAVGVVEAKVIAGDRQNGKPRDQLVVMPRIDLLEGLR